MQRQNIRDNNFDLIRLVAALQVVFVQRARHLRVPIARSVLEVVERFPRVPIFFVISGFLVSSSYERSSRLSAYAKNRLLRIYPGLWVCFVASVATVLVFHGPHASVPKVAAWILAQLSIGQVYNPDFLRGYGVGALNGSLWTIPVELQFYLALPLLYFFFERLRWNRLVLGLIAVGLVVIYVEYARLKTAGAHEYVKVLGVTVVPRLYLFLAGVFLQRTPGVVDRYLRSRASYWLIAYAGVSAALGFAGADVTGNLLNPVCALTLAGLTISLALTPIAQSHRWLSGNDISYGVYIYHMVAINALVESGHVGRGLSMIGALLMTIAAAIASWRFVEAPALRLKSLHAQGRSGAGRAGSDRREVKTWCAIMFSDADRCHRVALACARFRTGRRVIAT